MRISALYTHPEVNALTARRGITKVIVKLTTDDGLVGGDLITKHLFATARFHLMGTENNDYD